jgi:hypothetical protein
MILSAPAWIRPDSRAERVIQEFITGEDRKALAQAVRWSTAAAVRKTYGAIRDF